MARVSPLGQRHCKKQLRWKYVCQLLVFKDRVNAPVLLWDYTVQIKVQVMSDGTITSCDCLLTRCALTHVL